MRTTDRVYQILLIEDTDANLVKGSEDKSGSMMQRTTGIARYRFSDTMVRVKG